MARPAKDQARRNVVALDRLIALFAPDSEKVEGAEGEGTKERVPPKEFQILNAGIVKTTKGEFLFDVEAAGMVMDEYSRHGVDLNIDYDHAILGAGQGGAKSIAAGWFKLEIRGGALWAVDVSWTPAADAHLRSGEYRYFSPLMASDPATGRITSLINLALTNVPAMDGIAALVAASATTATDEGDRIMEEKLKESLARIAELERQNATLATELATLKPVASTVVALAGVVGLAKGADGSELQAKVTALSAFQKDVLSVVGSDNPTAVIGSIGAMKAAQSELVDLKKKVDAEKQTALSAQFSAALDQASKDGKIDPSPGDQDMSQRGWWERRAKEEGLEKALVTLGAFVPKAPAKTKDPEDKPPGKFNVSTEQMEINALMGLNNDEFRAFEEKRLAAGRR